MAAKKKTKAGGKGKITKRGAGTAPKLVRAKAKRTAVKRSASS
jgi:hypothetical protein